MLVLRRNGEAAAAQYHLLPLSSQNIWTTSLIDASACAGPMTIKQASSRPTVCPSIRPSSAAGAEVKYYRVVQEELIDPPHHPSDNGQRTDGSGE